MRTLFDCASTIEARYVVGEELLRRTQTISLIPSSINNGRIYFAPECVKFFPADSFGDREEGGHIGVPVVFEAGGEDFVTDIRVSSDQRLSPAPALVGSLKPFAPSKATTCTSSGSQIVAIASPHQPC